MKKILRHKAGFTLVELMISMVISVMVFGAMGSLLVKTMRLWCDGAGQWNMANQARMARARLLSGALEGETGSTAGTGLLSISSKDPTIKTDHNWCTLDYEVASLGKKFWLKGSVDNSSPADKSLFIKENAGGGQTELAVIGVKRGHLKNPDVMVDTCSMTQSNKTLNVRYNLHCEVGGKTHNHPQIIKAYMVNSTNAP